MLATFVPHETTIVERLISLGGIPILVLLAWLMSADRKKISWKPVIWGVALQLLFGAAVLSPALSEFFFTVVDKGVKWLIGFAEEGASFVFGTIDAHQVLDMNGQPRAVPFGVSPPVRTFAFWILPTIIFFSSLMSIGYHLGIMQRLVYAVAWVMQRTMGTSGAESLATAANIFVGQTEAPLLVKPFVEKMTRSELHAVMTAGFATVAGGVMAAYVGFLKDIPGIAGHLVTASIISAPAAIAISKVMMPEDGVPVTLGKLSIEIEKTSRNVIEAAARGAAEGVQLVLNVGGMLIAFVAIMKLIDAGIGLIPIPGDQPLSLSMLLGFGFAPIAFIMGVPWDDCVEIGRLLGEKIVLTEFVAYINLGALSASATPVITERSAIIASYGLCGFANFASIGIQLGGIGGLAPNRMGDLAELGLRAMVAGSLACFMTGCVAGVLIG
ncbi:MAG: NupC/NupG family nucleoside CNT transporter [Deltaproteobacteria bacterium]|nr:NupC/NupG family nucleoside CNT transporter [Deltaproteobacteria bacterium]